MRRLLFALCLATAGVGTLVLAQQPVKLVDSSHVDVPLMTVTEVQQDVNLTVASTKGYADFGRASTARPTSVGGDDRAVLGWFNRDGARAVFPSASPAGGALTCYLPSAASTNSTLCKNAAGTIYDIHVINLTSTPYYLRLYNLSAAPTCSSSTGYIESIPVPANTSGAGVSFTFPVGRNYGAGIGFCYTLNGTNNDNTAAGTGSYISIGYY